MFDFIATNDFGYKTDFITWTGDTSPHNTWTNTKEEVAEYVRNVTQTLKDSLGSNSQIDIFPALGNHDVWPINTEDLTKPDSNWDINMIKEDWLGPHWLSDEEHTQFGTFGYYSKPLSFTNGKVLALNTQTCNEMNWWLFQDRDDPAGIMQWLEDELAALEKDQGIAVIIGHIPPVECLHEFGYRFKGLMERYQHIVRFQIYGHTHEEGVNINRAVNTYTAIQWQLIAGSGTPVDNRNPSFLQITWDKELMVPINIHTYYMNLTKANESPDQ